MTAFAIERADGRRNPAGIVRADGDREQDRITLIALHVLEVLDENGLVPASWVEKGLELGVLAALLIEQVFDQPLLFTIEGDNADRAAVGDEVRSLSRRTTSAVTDRASSRFTRPVPRS